MHRPAQRHHASRRRSPVHVGASLGVFMGMSLLLPTTLPALESAPRSFDIPAGDATAALKRFAAQAHEQLLYSTDDVSGLSTQAIVGEFVPLAALHRMLANTPLRARQDASTQAISITLSRPSRAPPAEPLPPAAAPLSPSPSPTPKPNSTLKTSRILTFFAGWLAATSVIPAQPTGSPGTISGRVDNLSTGRYLQGVEIRLDDGKTEAVTDNQGRYSLYSVTGGDHTLEFSYVGLTTQKQAVTVPSGANAIVDVSLDSNAYKLDKFVVVGEREGRAAAISRQRSDPGIKGVIATDEYQNVSSGNIGELLKNVPGVAIDYAGQDARSIRVRGIASNLNSVTVDSMRFASAASGGRGRSFDLDQVTLQNYSVIEVSKAPTPDMEASSIGGNVNLVTKSAFEQKGRIVTAALNFNVTNYNLDGLDSKTRSINGGGTAEKIRPGGNLYFSDTFNVFGGRNNLGVVFTFNDFDTIIQAYRINKDLGRNTQQPNADIGALNYTRISSWYLNDSPAQTHRKGVSLNLDYRLTASTTLHLYTQANSSLIANRNRQFRLNANTYTADSDLANTTAVQAANNQAIVNVDFNDKVGASYGVNPGAKQMFGPLTLTYDVFVNQSANKYRDIPTYYSGITATLPNIGFTLNGRPDASAPAVVQTAGPDLFNLNNYSTMQLNSVQRSGMDKFVGWKVDAKREFSGAIPFFLKTGAQSYDEYRYIDNPRRRWNYSGPAGNFGQLLDSTTKLGTTVTRWNLPQPPLFSPQAVTAFAKANPQLFPEDKVYAIQSEAGRSYQHERITGAYFMGSFKFGQLTLLTGGRMEWTSDDGSGQRMDKVLSHMKAGDFFLIQFGHNDSKPQWPQTYTEPATTFKAYLHVFLAETRRRGATLVLVTPMERRNNGDTVGPWARAMREFAAAEKVPLIDQWAMSKEMWTALGPNVGTAFNDQTHLSGYGGYLLSKLIVRGIKASVPGLAKFVVDDFKDMAPSQPEPPPAYLKQSPGLGAPSRAGLRPAPASAPSSK